MTLNENTVNDVLSDLIEEYKEITIGGPNKINGELLERFNLKLKILYDNILDYYDKEMKEAEKEREKYKNHIKNLFASETINDVHRKLLFDTLNSENKDSKKKKNTSQRRRRIELYDARNEKIQQELLLAAKKIKQISIPRIEEKLMAWHVKHKERCDGHPKNRFNTIICKSQSKI